MSKNTLPRNIYYYDVMAYTGRENEQLVPDQNQEKILIECFEKIKIINDNLNSETNPQNRLEILQRLELKTRYGDKIYIIVDNIDYENSIVRYRIILCRLDALPYIEKNGNLINMVSMVDGDFNIAEVTHCVLFAKHAIVGAEFNFNGARPSVITNYLPNIDNRILHLQCTGKIRHDMFERIVEDKTLSLFELSIKNTPEMRRILREDMGLLGAFTQTINDFDTYEICLKRKKSKKREGFTSPLSIQQMQSLVDNQRDFIQNFKISQGAYKDSIDLLADKMVCHQSFTLTENRCIDSAEIYGITENFFDSVIRNQ